jgi:putative membrane protein
MRKALLSALLMLGGSASAQSYNDHDMGWNMHGYGYGGFLVYLLLLVLIGLVVYFIVRQQRTDGSGLETPLDILKKRYARGEISKEDYDRMKNDLS